MKLFASDKLNQSVNRDFKILDAVALKNALASERAWVVTATFARGKET